MEHVAGTEWEIPVVLGGLYGMRRSEVLGLRWKNIDLKKEAERIRKSVYSIMRQEQQEQQPHKTKDMDL